MTQLMLTPAMRIAQALQIKPAQVEAVIRLLDDSATVPFIARYRKEMTGGLDDTQLRQLAAQLVYLRDLDERRLVVINSIREQGLLTPELEQQCLLADTKNRLEDLYLPFRPKRRTKAQIAREAGLEPLATALREDLSLDPIVYAEQFIQPELGIADAKAALEGAGQIVMELFAENADLINELREYLWQHAIVQSLGVAENSEERKNAKKSGKKDSKKDTTDKYTDYFKYAEPIKKIPSHRALALFRGRREGVLQVSLLLTDNPTYPEERVASYFHLVDDHRPAAKWLREMARLAWRVKLSTKLESELLARLRESADEAAIRVFATNLRALLLNAPAGQKVTIGLDPGIRTGVKVAVVDVTGKLLDYSTIFPLSPQNEWHQSVAEIAKLAAKFNVTLISIGNGTGSRETERLVADVIKTYPDLHLTKVLVSEAGASVYSASELAALEFPDVDVSIRGAVSIARRLQDPLAELVKIEPKAIGVGQYQHDVNQLRLTCSLEGVVEDCVNAVGVDVNTASAPLLTHIAGLSEAIAKNIIQYRDEHGLFVNREQLKAIPRMGDKTYQQAAGFLRIMTGDNPLDASAVHPEAYPLVEKIAQHYGLAVKELIGNYALLNSVNAETFVDDTFGLPTIRDVLSELEKPGRDPRPVFKTVTFKEGVEEIAHLSEGMTLQGVVSNVTNFGAFVDIGVHQDGLVHISELKNGFVTDPYSVIKAGDIVTVRVIDVDKVRRRIGLSMKLEAVAKPAASAAVVKTKMKAMDAPATDQSVASPSRSADKSFQKREHNKPVGIKSKPQQANPSVKPVKKGMFNTSMADAFAKLKRESE